MIVSQTIFRQLGGNRFAAVTGAKDFVGSTNSLSFSLPGAGGFTRRGINKVSIKLTPDDLYEMSFYRIRKGQQKLALACDEVFSDQLIPAFEEATGLVASI